MNHVIKLEFDPQRGGWVWRCSCGEESKRPSWYKRRTRDDAALHKAMKGPEAI